MSSYIKIHSKVEIDEDKFDCYNARFFFDFDRQEDESDEGYRYEYFLELTDEDDNDPKLQVEFQDDCRDLLKKLNKSIGGDNYYITNMSGVHLP